jgi:hypothetical protein
MASQHGAWCGSKVAFWGEDVLVGNSKFECIPVSRTWDGTLCQASDGSRAKPRV